MKKFYYLLSALFILITSCKSEFFFDNSSTTKSTSASQTIKYNYGNDKTSDIHGLVLDLAGTPISGALITIGTSSVTTSADGFFSFKNVSVKENFAYIKATKSGFINGSKVIMPTSGNNQVNIMMIPDNTTAIINTGSPATVSLPDGTKIKFDGNFKDANGNAYNGKVNVKLYSLASSNKYLKEIMPGALLANDTEGNTKVLETFGMVKVKLSDDAGNKLQIADGHKAEITFPIDATQTSVSPNEIPLWYFDEESGFWKEEGKAIKSGNTYIGNVSHFSWWNCDYPYAYCKLTVRALDANNLPIKNVSIGIQLNDLYPRKGITNSDGIVSGIVPANGTLKLIAYDNCNNVIFTKDIGSFKEGSENNLSINIPTNTLNKYKISGILKDCSDNVVNEGVVYLKKNNSSENYFQHEEAIVKNGVFSFDTYLCSQSLDFTITGYDNSNLKTTGELKFTANSQTFDVGSIVACDVVSEYIKYQIDNNPEVILNTYPNAKMRNGNISMGNPNIGNYFSYYGNDFVVGSQQQLKYFSFQINDNNKNQYTILKEGNDLRGNANFNVTSIGAVKGSYIDFTFEGTCLDTSSVSHQIKGTVHVMSRY